MYWFEIKFLDLSHGKFFQDDQVPITVVSFKHVNYELIVHEEKCIFILHTESKTAVGLKIKDRLVVLDVGVPGISLHYKAFSFLSLDVINERSLTQYYLDLLKLKRLLLVLL